MHVLSEILLGLRLQLYASLHFGKEITGRTLGFACLSSIGLGVQALGDLQPPITSTLALDAAVGRPMVM
jgi:hypothetical protein